MVFSSTIFLFAFLVITLLGYYLIHPKLKNVFLLIMSLFFYAWGEPKFVFIMIGSIIINYIFGLLVDKFRDSKVKSHIIIAGMVTFNLSLFFVFKYLNFTISNINNWFDAGIVQTDIALPIGISFFTFQAMSYVIDVYRKNGKVQKNPLNVALYITFFPQLIAGPIVRYETVAEQINKRTESIELFSKGVYRFVIGLSKKIILSNSVALVADKAFGITDYSELSVATAWIGALCYTMQIFFDFSGYSDMAIGLAYMFGFKLEENFNYPYISKSVSEFWRRWHISLGTWFRDYVYFPLGGSRVSNKGRLLFNLLVVWLLTGIWHGANWTFIIWGLFYFVLLVFEKFTGYPAKFKNPVAVQLYRVFTLFSVVIGWVLFRSDNITNALNYLACMFGANSNAVADNTFIFMLKSNLFILILCVIFCMPVIPRLKEKFFTKNKTMCTVGDVIKLLSTAVLFVISISFVVSSTYNPFIYFNF